MKPHLFAASHGFESANLMEQQQFKFGRSDLNFAASSISTAPRSWMSPEPNVELFRELNALFHRFQIAVMAATSYSGRRDPAHQRACSHIRFAFTQVAIEIDFHATGSKRIFCPGRHWASQEICGGSIAPSFG